jgi:hypothetical protein
MWRPAAIHGPTQVRPGPAKTARSHHHLCVAVWPCGRVAKICRGGCLLIRSWNGKGGQQPTWVPNANPCTSQRESRYTTFCYILHTTRKKEEGREISSFCKNFLGPSPSRPPSIPSPSPSPSPNGHIYIPDPRFFSVPRREVRVRGGWLSRVSGLRFRSAHMPHTPMSMRLCALRSA